MPRRRAGLAGVVAVLGMLAGGDCSLAASAPCQPIRFEAGHASTTLRGMAPVEAVACYSMATGRGQTATLKVTAGGNTVFTIDGLIDAQDDYSFTTAHKTYRILVGQLMRAVSPEAFVLTVTVK